VRFLPTSFWVRLRALIFIFFSSAPSSPRPLKVLCFLPYLLSSAPSSPRPSKVVHFLSYLLLNAPSSPHLISFRVRFRALDHQSCRAWATSRRSSTLECVMGYIFGKYGETRNSLSLSGEKMVWESPPSILVTRNPNWSQRSGTGTGCVKGRY
jgi:hypothetical protein